MNSIRLQRLGRRSSIAVGAALSMVSTILVVPGLVGTAEAAENSVTITVTKGGVRTGSGAGTVGDLNGATFKAYAVANSGVTTPAGGTLLDDCLTAGAGTCDLTFTLGNSSAQRVLVVETAAPAGYSVIEKVALGDSSTAQVNYVTNVSVRNGDTVSLPATSPGGRWANRKDNPALPDKCGLDVALVFDTSGSISGTEMGQMKTAAKGFVDAISGTPSNVGVFKFASTAPGSATIPKQSVLGGGTTVNNAIDNTSNIPAAGNGSTNWDAGLYQVARATEKYDAVIVLTDGDPTRWNDGGNGSSVDLRNVTEAVFSANAVKATGARVIAVGIGMQAASVVNLQAISGTTADSDYYTTNFANLGTTLGEIARKACGGTVTVEKQLGSQIVPGTTTSGENGWKFASAVTTGNGTVSPASGTTNTFNGFQGQVQFEAKSGSWPKKLTFTEPTSGNPTGYSLKDIKCYLGGNEITSPNSITKDIDGRSVTVSVGLFDAVRCVFLNQKDDVVVTPVKPTLVAPTCDAPGFVRAPSTEGVLYTDNGDGTWTATPKDGYRFDGAQSVTYTGLAPAAQLDCVVPAVPTKADAQCTTPGQYGLGSITIPSTPGVQYAIGGVNKAAGTYDYAAGSYTVTATAISPKVIKPGSTVSWPLTITAPEDCRVLVAPEPPVLVPPTCTVAGSVTVPTTTGVLYTDNGNGTWTATPKSGYKFAGSQSVLYTGLAPLPRLNCVVPEIPTKVDAVCVAPGQAGDGSITIPSTVGVVYSIDGVVAPAGPNAVTVGNHTVTAAPASSYTITPGSTTSWPLSIAAPADCRELVTPVTPIPTDPTCTSATTVPLPTTPVGVVYKSVTNQDGSITVTATPASGYKFSGAQTVSWTFTVSPALACVTPVEPVPAPAICTGPGTYGKGSITVTPVAGVVYKIGDTVLSSGANALNPGTYTVTASVADGYVLAPGAKASWELEILAPLDCTVVVTPVAPSVSVSQRCDVEGTYTIPNTPGVTYLLDGIAVAPNTYSGPKTALVTAQAKFGYVLSAPLMFGLNLPAALECATPVPPIVEQAESCDVEGTYEIVATEGVRYLLGGTEIEPGVYSGPVSGLVTAQALPGYQLVNSTWSFQLNVTAALDCPIVRVDKVARGGGSTEFGFTATNPAGGADVTFALTDGSKPYVLTYQDGGKEGTSVSIAELATDRWKLAGIVCGPTDGDGSTVNGDSVENLVVKAGDDITCTFTNKPRYLVTVVARSCPTYDDVIPNVNEPELQREADQPLGGGTTNNPPYTSSNVRVSPDNEAYNGNHEDCTPISGWRTTLGRNVTHPAGGLGIVTGPYADSDFPDNVPVTEASTAELDDQGNPVGTDQVEGAVTVELNDDMADRAQYMANLRIQGGTPTATLNGRDDLKFAAIRCSNDNRYGDNVEWIQFPSAVTHVYCYLYYVKVVAKGGIEIVKSASRAPGAANQEADDFFDSVAGVRGQTTVFRYDVTNTGNTSVTNLVLGDELNFGPSLGSSVLPGLDENDLVNCRVGTTGSPNDPTNTPFAIGSVIGGDTPLVLAAGATVHLFCDIPVPAGIDSGLLELNRIFDIATITGVAARVEGPVTDTSNPVVVKLFADDLDAFPLKNIVDEDGTNFRAFDNLGVITAPTPKTFRMTIDNVSDRVLNFTLYDYFKNESLGLTTAQRNAIFDNMRCINYDDPSVDFPAGFPNPIVGTPNSGVTAEIFTQGPEPITFGSTTAGGGAGTFYAKGFNLGNIDPGDGFEIACQTTLPPGEYALTNVFRMVAKDAGIQIAGGRTSGVVRPMVDAVTGTIDVTAEAGIEVGTPTEPVPSTITLTAESICLNGTTPYVDWSVAGAPAGSAITYAWLNTANQIKQTGAATGISGRQLWPGTTLNASGTPTDWPGWDQDADGDWFEVPTDLRPTMQFKVLVAAPGGGSGAAKVTATGTDSAVVTLAYPAGDPECGPKPVEPVIPVEPETPDSPGTLPQTGASVDRLALAGALGLLLGIGLIIAGVRRREDELEV